MGVRHWPGAWGYKDEQNTTLAQKQETEQCGKLAHQPPITLQRAHKNRTAVWGMAMPGLTINDPEKGILKDCTLLKLTRAWSVAFTV